MSVTDQEDAEMGPAGADGLLESPEAVKAFMLAGAARLTLRSLATGARYSYRIKRAPTTGPRPNASEAKRPWFVSVLVGPDNEQSYMYLGNIWKKRSMISYDIGSKSRIKPEAPSAVAFRYFFDQVITIGHMPPKLEVWHEGRCGRCGRALTVPSSIASGFGPECAQKGLGI